MRDFRIFLDTPLHFLARVDKHLGTKIMSLTFTDPILALLGKNIRCLCDCKIVWLRAIKIFIDAKLNSPAQVETKITS